VIRLVNPKERPAYWYMDIGVPAEQLWGLFANFRDIGRWWPGEGARFDFIGDGIGMIRNIYIEDGPLISQRLDAVNDAQMTITSTFLNCFDFGMDSFRGTMGVQDLGDDWSRLTYAAIAEVSVSSGHDMHMDAVESYIDGFYKALKMQLESKGIDSGEATSDPVRAEAEASLES
jgi:hypothetical protein